MATFDSTYLLSAFNRKAGRPTPPEGTDAITDDSKYQQLTESQHRIVAMLSGIMPNVLYPTGAFPTLSTVDQKVFTFGTDSNGYPITPMGKTGIYSDLSAIPSCPWRAVVDYLDEGTQIRIPNNGTYSGTLYWRGITPPPDITATSQPVLFPAAARELIVIDAVRQFATEYDRNPSLVANMQSEWVGNPALNLIGAWPSWCLVWKTQFRAGGALGSFTGLDLAVLGQSSFVTV